MDAMMALFQKLVSPEQKSLSELVDASGGVKHLRNDDQMLLALDEKASKALGASSAEMYRARGETVDDLRDDILEKPDAAAERNQTTFHRKFEVQKRQIIYELTLVVKRESDRVIQEMKGGPHERILDRVCSLTILVRSKRTIVTCCSL
jgi:hypothetical protein